MDLDRSVKVLNCKYRLMNYSIKYYTLATVCVFGLISC